MCNLPKVAHKSHGQDLNPGSLTSPHGNIALSRRKESRGLTACKRNVKEVENGEDKGLK